MSDILPIKTMNKFFNVVEILSHGPNQTSHHMRNKVIQYYYSKLLSIPSNVHLITFVKNKRCS